LAVFSVEVRGVRSEFDNNVERCASYDRNAGRCQLASGHAGPHAVRTDDKYLTWDMHEVSHWSSHKPPLWIFDLAWCPGLQPDVPLFDS
jgi:hypothetical protein